MAGSSSARESRSVADLEDTIASGFDTSAVREADSVQIAARSAAAVVAVEVRFADCTESLGDGSGLRRAGRPGLQHHERGLPGA